ncbi:MAG TPA: two-component regulator propeller domain-containing protein [Balneolaceae bacterium]|nr:two-component regulator propeller domain-containing protein [Balneolaceae bacterium]
MKKYDFIIPILLVFLFPVQTAAQQYNFQIYSVNKGLPHVQVHDIFQTHDGYIWLATFGGGLAKFDGRSFKIFDIKDGLKTNTIEVVFEDSRHNLWVSTNNRGVAKMNGNSFVYPFENTALDSLTVLAIEEIDSKLWLGTSAGFFVYDYKKDELSRGNEKYGLINNIVWDFWKAPGGEIWIATQHGLSIYDGQNFRNLTEADGLGANKIFQIAAQPNGDVWLATNNGITIWDGKAFSTITEIMDIPLNYVFDLLVTSTGATWIGTELNGVFVYEDESFTHYTTKNGLSSNYIYELYEDNRQNVWIGTDADGVSILKGKAFEFIGVESGLESKGILSLHKSQNGRVWAGTQGGIFYKDDDGFKSFPIPSKYTGAAEVWDITEFQNGDMLFLMSDDALYKWDGETLINYSQKNGLEQWFTYDIYVDKENSLWLGTNEGLFHFTEGELTRYTDQDGLAGNVVQYLYEFKDYLWIGTLNGLSRFDGHSFKNITVKDGLQHKAVVHITSDSKGNIWLGTGGGISLLKLDGQGDVLEIENFGKDEGMKLVKTQIIWFDDAGYLWHGTNGGLHRLDVPGYWKTGEMSLVHYSLSDAGIGIETNHKAVIPISENGALFGTMNGILKIRPSLLHADNTAPPVHITQIERNSRPLKKLANTDSVAYQFGRRLFDGLNFPYGQHSYTFHFAALEYENPQSIEYRYRLKGFDDKWSAATSSTSATFTSLDAGNYTFEVQAKGRQEFWPRQAAAVNFTIDNPYWQTYWFYMLALLAFGGLVYGYIQMRVQMLEKEQLKDLVDEQTKDLTAALEEKEVLIKEIHHRVKNNLAVISGLLELQVGYSEDDFVAKVLRESQRRVKSISMIHEKLYQNERLSEINFTVYIDELVEIIADSHHHPNKEIEVETIIDDVALGVNQGIPCGLILNELLSNAFEHAFKDRAEGKVTIKLKDDNGQMEFSVSDDGVGLPSDFENAKAQSLGITLVETLTLQLEGRLKVTRLEKGTCFTIIFVKEKVSLTV